VTVCDNEDCMSTAHLKAQVRLCSLSRQVQPKPIRMETDLMRAHSYVVATLATWRRRRFTWQHVDTGGPACDARRPCRLARRIPTNNEPDRLFLPSSTARLHRSQSLSATVRLCPLVCSRTRPAPYVHPAAPCHDFIVSLCPGSTESSKSCVLPHRLDQRGAKPLVLQYEPPREDAK
jgi:hypothetical protein